MQVLQVVANMDLQSGGPSRSVAQLTELLRHQGVGISVAGRLASGPYAVPLEHHRLPWQIPTRRSTAVLADAIEASQLVHIHGLWNGTVSLAAHLCRSRQIPYILTPHGMLDPICLAHHRLRKQIYGLIIENATLRGATGFHFLSDEERRRAGLGRALADRVAVAPNGSPAVPSVKPGTLQAAFPGATGRQVLLYLGRLDRIKGVDLQLVALARIPERERPVLIIVGPDFGDEARLRGIAHRQGLERWVIWGGAVYGDERFSLLAEADAVLVTSVYDCNPIVVTEALAVGAVVVGTEGCGGIEAAAARQAALGVPRSAADLALALRGLLGDQPRRARMRSAARAYAATALRPSELVQPLLRLYESLTVRPRSGAAVTS